MASFSTLTAVLLLLSTVVISQDASPCTADQIEEVVEVVNLVARIDFVTCSSSVDFNFDDNLPEFLQALAGECTNSACNDGFQSLLPIIEAVPDCTINPSGDSPILLIDAFVQAGEQCAELGGGTDPINDGGDGGIGAGSDASIASASFGVLFLSSILSLLLA